MQNISSFFSHPMIKKLDIELDKIFQKVPHLPKKAIEILVKIAPILILVSGLFLITGGLRSIFGANDFYRIFNAWKGVPAIYFYITGLLQILAGVVSLSIYNPIKNKDLQGWYGLLCLNIIQVTMSLIAVIFVKNGLFDLLFSLFISLYVLYEIKPEFGTAIKTSAKIKVIKKDKAKIKTKKK